MTRLVATLAIVASLALAAPALAAQPRYAAPTGSGSTCSSAIPCSLKTAIESAPSDGFEVIVRSGNYTYDSTFNFSKRLNVHGEAGQPRPRILPASGFTGQAFFVSAAPGAAQIQIARLEIRSSQISVHILSDDVMLSNLILTATGTSGSAAYFEAAGTRTLRDSVASTTGDNAVALIANGGTLHVRNVTAYSSGAASVGISVRGYCYKMPAQTNCFNSVTHAEADVLNTIARGVQYAIAVGADPDASAKLTIGHSNFASQAPPSGDATIVDAGGNQSQPPLYTTTQFFFTFHERAGSPTIDAGIADPLSGETDWDGDPRTLGDAPDIGVDEFVPSARSNPGDPGTGDPGTGDPGTGDPGASGPPDTTAPALTDVAIAPGKFRAAATGPSAAAVKTRATVVYTLSEPAMVSFRVERRAAGRRVGKRCVKPTRRNRSRKRCRRYLPVKGGFDRLGVTGVNGFKFTGRIADRRLRVGRYRLVAMAADAAGNLSPAARAPFRIVR